MGQRGRVEVVSQVGTASVVEAGDFFGLVSHSFSLSETDLFLFLEREKNGQLLFSCTDEKTSRKKTRKKMGKEKEEEKGNKRIRTEKQRKKRGGERKRSKKK